MRLLQILPYSTFKVTVFILKLTVFSGSDCYLLPVLLAQLSSLSSLPPAERTQRETTLQSKRATVEAWLTREASTLQKYRLVWRDTIHTHIINCSSAIIYSDNDIQRWLILYTQRWFRKGKVWKSLKPALFTSMFTSSVFFFTTFVGTLFSLLVHYDGKVCNHWQGC